MHIRIFLLAYYRLLQLTRVTLISTAFLTQLQLFLFLLYLIGPKNKSYFCGLIACHMKQTYDKALKNFGGLEKLRFTLFILIEFHWLIATVA